jgi:hypothetical protein
VLALKYNFLSAGDVGWLFEGLIFHFLDRAQELLLNVRFCRFGKNMHEPDYTRKNLDGSVLQQKQNATSLTGSYKLLIDDNINFLIDYFIIAIILCKC